MNETEKQGTYQKFQDSVNMTKNELEKWLDSDESRSVGIEKDSDNIQKTKDSESESIGHDSGRKIIEILSKNKSDLIDADYEHMRKVNGYVARHSAQKPQGDIENSRWRYSLMNWGNDPLK